MGKRKGVKNERFLSFFVTFGQKRAGIYRFLSKKNQFFQGVCRFQSIVFEQLLVAC
ncbi:MAG: hypothetical protein KAS69_02500 [Planctomycetes bacterium]|nr:hypothetical protein [Planctomycetota bacterium]